MPWSDVVPMLMAADCANITLNDVDFILVTEEMAVFDEVTELDNVDEYTIYILDIHKA